MMKKTQAKPLTAAQQRQRDKKRRTWLRAGVQLFFFVSMPGAFVAGFSGVKQIFLHIGAGEVLSADSFTLSLLGLAVQMFWCGQALAAKGLVQESTNVYVQLKKGDLPAARKAVSRIVGRDTDALTAEGVTRAAVETVAENASDGVIAPLLYMLLGGAPLALTYKAINTMDSMLGYKNEKYLYFGRAAAKLDDVANYIPSRLAALLWIMAAAFTRNDAKGAWRIWRRDRRNHASPNSAQTESACAGALGVQLAGPAYYFGEYYPKPTIGDPLRPIEPEDILRADRMMYVASGFALAFGCAIRGFLG